LDPGAAGFEERLRQLTDGERFDVVFEATGSPAALTPALKLAAHHGRVVALGSTPGLVKLDDHLDAQHTGRRSERQIGMQDRARPPLQDQNVRALIRAAIDLLKAVLSLLQAVLLALFEGLKSLGQATGQGAAFVGRGVTEGARLLLLKTAQGVVSTLDAKPDGHQRRWQSARL
jgi:threonine dehydrogenase-like Zn-dependent dehydrogenase